MANCKKLTLLISTLLLHFFSIAQTTAASLKPEEPGFLRSEGKIYVVMVVVITILSGLIFYVFRLDKKISGLEKGQK